MTNVDCTLDKDEVRIVLFEGIHESAVEQLAQSGYTAVERLTTSLSGAELEKKLATAHLVGIRSRTHLGAPQLEAAPQLIAIGAFCIGTNQIDLPAAARRGVPVFNAPHSNTRSVAELVIAESVMLMRGIPEKNAGAHEGRWLKSASDSFELRGKTIGIVGYGHIGSQVSILAEAMGMQVIYHDFEPKLPMGNAKQRASLSDVLSEADIVTLHVPAAPDTVNLMNAERIAEMKKGAYLINASRGNVVDIEALAEAIRASRLRGAAVDVYPKEPKGKDERFESPLRGLPSVLLTPHIGGSTQEAQHSIGIEVARKLIQFMDAGATVGSVNFPNLRLTPHTGAHRLLHIHENRPGVLGALNRIFAESSANVVGQYLQTTPDLGYVVVDVELDGPMAELEAEVRGVDGTIRTRTLPV